MRTECFKIIHVGLCASMSMSAAIGLSAFPAWLSFIFLTEGLIRLLMHVQLYVCVCARTYAYIYIHIVCTFAYTYMCLDTCTCVFYIYIYMYRDPI